MHRPPASRRITHAINGKQLDPRPTRLLAAERRKRKGKGDQTYPGGADTPARSDSTPAAARPAQTSRSLTTPLADGGTDTPHQHRAVHTRRQRTEDKGHHSARRPSTQLRGRTAEVTQGLAELESSDKVPLIPPRTAPLTSSSNDTRPGTRQQRGRQR